MCNNRLTGGDGRSLKNSNIRHKRSPHKGFSVQLVFAPFLKLITVFLHAALQNEEGEEERSACVVHLAC